MSLPTARKRYTTKEKKKYTWEYVVDVPSNEFDIFGKPKRKQLTKSGFKTKKEALEAGKEVLEKLQAGKLELTKDAAFGEIMQYFFDHIEHEGNYAYGTISNYKGLYKNHLQMFVKVPVKKLNHALIKASTIYNPR